jgi:hypothetical protein
MRLCIERSKALATLSPFRSWLDCTINTSGYDFRKGHVICVLGFIGLFMAVATHL